MRTGIDVHSSYSFRHFAARVLDILRATAVLAAPNFISASLVFLQARFTLFPNAASYFRMGEGLSHGGFSSWFSFDFAPDGLHRPVIRLSPPLNLLRLHHLPTSIWQFLVIVLLHASVWPPLSLAHLAVGHAAAGASAHGALEFPKPLLRRSAA